MNSMKSIPAALLLCLAAATAWGDTPLPAPVVKGIRVFGSGENFGVEITADRDLIYSCTKIPPLLRVVVDLPLTEPGRPDTDYRVDSAMISTIRLERKEINDVLVSRIVINLVEDAEYSARLDPADRKKLTVSLHRNPPQPAAAAPATQVAAPPAAPAPAPPLPAVKATVAAGAQPVTVGGVHFSADAIDIETGGAVTDFKAFTLRGPERLVIDIPAARSTVRGIPVPANRFGVTAARIGTFEGKLRLVFETGQKPFPGYSVERTGTGLRVLTRK